MMTFFITPYLFSSVLSLLIIATLGFSSPAHPGLMPPFDPSIKALQKVFSPHRDPSCVHICNSGVFRGTGCTKKDVESAREWCLGDDDTYGDIRPRGGLDRTEEWFCCECLRCQGARQTTFPVTTIRRTTCKEEAWRSEPPTEYQTEKSAFKK
ncbi:hypothetical protein EX30DRAFT_215564 [Ascodesmis nigricans]|uniref:Uncharacterized protein n=1 Tax=Ascodesmis nigricans TaxID=341454 RepID=A0A4S2MZ83_9PEZI|nr:hypothetical protein EX30DRAFT_215564 [Ascodesmis nigricans]